MYLLAQQQAQAGTVADTSRRNLGYQQALVNFGQIPTGINANAYGLGGEFQNMANQANQSGVSTMAQLQRGYEEARRQRIAGLAARGMLGSGETQWGLAEDQQNYTNAQHAATQELLQYLNGLSEAFAAGEQGRAEGLMSSAQQAYQTQLSLPQNQPTAATRAGLVRGTGWYRGADGQLYGQGGQEVNRAAARQRARAYLNSLIARGVSVKDRHNTRAYQRLLLLNQG